METARNVKAIRSLDASPVLLEIVSVEDLADWGSTENHVAVLAKDANGQHYADAVVVTEVPKPGETWQFTHNATDFPQGKKA